MGLEAGVWLVLTDLPWDAQTLLGPPPLTAALETAVVEARGLKGTRNKDTALTETGQTFSFCSLILHK